MVYHIVPSVILAMAIISLTVILRSSSRNAERATKQEVPLMDERHSHNR